MVLTVQSLIVCLLFSLIGLFHFIHSINLKKVFGSKHNFVNSALTSIMWVVAGLFYPLLYPVNDSFINSLSLMFISFVPLVFALLFFRRKSNRVAVNFDRTADLRRKVFHFIPPLLIIVLWLIGGSVYGLVLILTIGYGGLFFVELIDFARLAFIYDESIGLSSSINSLISQALKPRELFEPLKTAPLVLSLIPSLFFGFKVFAATAIVSSISDGAASVFGNFFGRKRFKGKTFIGFAAGFVASFIIIFLCFGFNYSSLILSFAGSIVFLLVDVFARVVDDNFLNPLLVGLTLGLINYLLH